MQGFAQDKCSDQSIWSQTQKRIQPGADALDCEMVCKMTLKGPMGRQNLLVCRFGTGAATAPPSCLLSKNLGSVSLTGLHNRVIEPSAHRTDVRSLPGRRHLVEFLTQSSPLTEPDVIFVIYRKIQQNDRKT